MILVPLLKLGCTHSIQTGIFTLINDTGTVMLTDFSYNCTDYTISLTPKTKISTFHYVISANVDSFTFSGEPNATYYWTTIGTTSDRA